MPNFDNLCAKLGMQPLLHEITVESWQIEIISTAECSKDLANKRIIDGSHNFLSNNRTQFVNENAVNNFVTSNIKRLEDGTHNLLKDNQTLKQKERWFDGSESKKRVEDGTHNWLKQNGGSESAKKAAYSLVEKRINDGSLQDHMKKMLTAQDFEVRSKKWKEKGTFKGGNNPAAVPVIVYGTRYDTLNEASASTGLSHYFIKKKIKQKVEGFNYAIKY
jgi:hypothetical protein